MAETTHTDQPRRGVPEKSEPAGVTKPAAKPADDGWTPPKKAGTHAHHFSSEIRNPQDLPDRRHCDEPGCDFWERLEPEPPNQPIFSPAQG